MSKSIVPALMLLLFEGACSTLMPAQPDFSSRLVLPKGNGSGTQPIYTAAQYRSRVDQVEPSSCTAFDTSPSPTAAGRNACVTDLMTDIDDAYGAYETAVSRRIGGTNAALDITAAAGGTVAAATSGTAAKVFAAIAAITTSSKAAISSDLLLKSSIQVVVSTMRADRAKLAAGIKLADQGSLTAYPMAQAKNDLLAYLYAGTVAHALNDATQEAAATAQKCAAAASKVTAAVDGGAVVTRASSPAAAATPATTTSDQCNQLADSYTFTFDSGASSTALLDFIAPKGVPSAAAISAANGCVKPQAPAGLDLAKYVLPKGKYDLATLASDPAITDAYKGKILSCAKAAMPAA